MTFQLRYVPVTRPLYLREYAPEFGAESLDVWVNPPPEFRAKQSSLLSEFLQRSASLEVTRQRAEKDSASQAAADLMREQDELVAWTEKVFQPAMDEWFAQVWGQRDPEMTAEFVRQIAATDESLSTWLRRRSVEMMTEHRTGRKKN